MAYQRPSMDSEIGASKSRANAVKCSRRKFLHVAAAATALTAISRAAWAQGYPSRPVRLIVGFPAGNAPDIIARLTGQFLSERLGRPIVVENRPGAGSNIAAQDVVNAPADGYTLLLAVSTNIFNATLYPKVKFDFIRDVAPVASIANAPFVIVVPPSFPAKTLPEFIAYAKANPGKINMASGGIGTAPHIYGELFKLMAGVDLVHVPYRGSYMSDLLGGQVQVVFNPLPQSIEYIRTGKLRALAVTTAKRLVELPATPTVSEFVPGYVAVGWFGIVAPRNTPADIVNKLNEATNNALAAPQMKARLAGLCVEPISMTPDEFGKFMADETEKWGKVIRAADIKLD